MSEELSGELHKLEITPAEVDLPPIKLFDITELPLDMNPFYEDEKQSLEGKCHEGLSHQNVAQKLRNQLGCRRCRLRRRSESVADDYKEVSQALSSSALDSTCWTHSKPGVQRQPLKNRRAVLRLPVLRKLQNLHKLLQTLPVECESAASVALGNTSAIRTEDNILRPPCTGHGISDFRDLLHECQNVLDLEADVKGRLGLVSPGQRISKNFTTIQQSLPSSNKLLSNGINTNALSRTNRSGGTTLPVNSIMQRNSISPSPEHNASAVARATRTSCSQQAGSSVTSGGNCDDVTIDELASYFDTFVHIPKKMSSMAEMMYI